MLACLCQLLLSSCVIVVCEPQKDPIFPAPNPQTCTFPIPRILHPNPPHVHSPSAASFPANQTWKPSPAHFWECLPSLFPLRKPWSPLPGVGTASLAPGHADVHLGARASGPVLPTQGGAHPAGQRGRDLERCGLKRSGGWLGLVEANSCLSYPDDHHY